jgi:hypothetical protein
VDNKVKMDQFDEIPDELIELIMGYLMPDERLTVTLVNKRFHRIISNSSDLMSQIVLKIDTSKVDPKVLAQSTRKYVNLTVEARSQSNLKNLDCFETICGNLKFLKFHPAKNCCLPTFPDPLHRQILQSSPKLQSLELSGIGLRSNQEPSSWSVPLPNLRQLKISSGLFDPTFIENLDKLTRLTTIKLSNLDYSKCNPRELILRQTCLQHLEIDSFFVTDMDDHFLHNFHVQLKVLKVKFDLRNYEKVVKLLGGQQRLAELAVLPLYPNMGTGSDEVALLDCLFQKKTVKKLTVNYPKDNYGDIYRNWACPQVEELRLYFLQNTEQGLLELQKILAIMPNLKTLHFSTTPRNDKGTFDENDLVFLNQLTTLENLYIGVSKSPNSVKFLELANLKRFAIDSYYKLSSQESQATKIMTGAVWLPFLKRHPRLVELNVSNLLLSKYLWNYIDTQHPGLKIVNIDVNNIR